MNAISYSNVLLSNFTAKTLRRIHHWETFRLWGLSLEANFVPFSFNQFKCCICFCSFSSCRNFSNNIAFSTFFVTLYLPMPICQCQCQYQCQCSKANAMPRSGLTRQFNLNTMPIHLPIPKPKCQCQCIISPLPSSAVLKPAQASLVNTYFREVVNSHFFEKNVKKFKIKNRYRSE